MANIKLTYLEEVKPKKKPQNYEEALKFIDVLEVEIQDIQEQIDTAIDLGENYHGYTQEEEEFHNWLKKARTAVAIKRKQTKTLKAMANSWKQAFAARLKTKNKNLVVKVEVLENKIRSLREKLKKAYDERELYQEACWEIFNILFDSDEENLKEEVYSILTEANPNFLDDYERARKVIK